MALAHPESPLCGKSELELFSVPPTQTVINCGRWVEYHPVASLSDEGPIEFLCTGSGEDYIDLANTHLQISASVQKEDGSELSEDDDVSTTNLWLHSLFCQVDVSLNGTRVSSSTHNYPYRAYLETALSFGSDAKQSQLATELWYKDTALSSSSPATNAGYQERKKRVARSRPVHMMGRLHSDLFFQDRHLINNVDLHVRLVRSKPGFALLAPQAGNYKVKIHRAILYCRKVEPQPSVVLAHIRRLETQNVKYPIRRVETKVFSVAAGTSVVNRENLFLGVLPRRLILGCVTNAAYNGSLQANPFNFEHHNLNFLVLHVDGKQVPSKALQPDFRNSDYVRCYQSLFQATGKLHQNDGNDISYSDYARGYALFAFDLTPDLSDHCYFQPVKDGTLRLEMRFLTPLTETLSVIVYAEFDNVIEIDRSRNVLFDYSA